MNNMIWGPSPVIFNSLNTQGDTWGKVFLELFPVSPHISYSKKSRNIYIYLYI